MKEILETLAKGENLAPLQAEQAFSHLLHGKLSPVQAGALLMGLRAKGETPDEVGAGVRACLREARKVDGLDKVGPRIDTCGTGGDCRSSFNCSTAVALMLAAMGYKVAKHGNRSVSSSCGSADVLEAMGVPLDSDPSQAAGELDRNNFVFLFAPAYHPAFKHVAPIRAEMGIRTLFNLMGPLLNPARPTHQLLGVAEPRFLPLMASVLADNGVERGAVVHGAGGFDELTPFGPSTVLWIQDGEVRPDVLDPEPLGLGGGRPDDVSVIGPVESLDVLRELLAGRGHPTMVRMLTLNLAVALHLLEGFDMATSAGLAREAVASGIGAERFGAAA
ncbi:anthranilate phosphoribosyltransferase [Desulfohalovibrio reitneri]|uniref:anthranilate phosphoribosyltransferase n=1 Tax=Desulfohalovibrio reitneri TaxID=1307759 RepID=UPI0004A6BA8D|nr:anthranilate phosphoribosyltransferase [Desulfohalovibrio reitneri]